MMNLIEDPAGPGGPGGGPGGGIMPAHQNSQNNQQMPLYMLQWHEHHTSFFRLMEELCREQNLTDVSITCGDVSLEAHSLILSASSPILRSILAKGEGKKQTLHFMDMNPYHMQLLLQYMYKGEISVPQAELATLMTSARSLQIKGLCNTASPPAPPPASGVAGVAGGVATSSISVPNAPPHPIPITAHQNPGEPPQVSIAENNRLSEFANYLATQTQPLPPPAVATNGPLDLGQPHINHLLEVEPPQQPIVQAATKKRRNAQDGATGKKKRKSKKPFEDLRNGELQHTTTGSLVVVPDSSNGVVAAGTGNNVSMAVDGMHDDDHVTGNEVVNNGEAATSGAPTASGGGGSSSENWNEQQTMKVKGHRIPILPKPLSQMKTTETRSYLSRLIWATNGWKRPQYGNPETKPVWWPNELLNWAEMKKMGGKKADGLSNVNYNEIQKTILNEGYRYFGYDPETLCHIKDDANAEEYIHNKAPDERNNVNKPPDSGEAKNTANNSDIGNNK